MSLVIGDHPAVTCGNGLLAAEYALFDASDVELRATSPGAVREAGYVTTAALALERLAILGVSDELVDGCADVARRALVARYARGKAAIRAAETLGAAELFAASTYDADAASYEGQWLDLPALAADLGVPRANLALQLVGLAAALLDVAPDTIVRLGTVSLSTTKPVGWRSHRRVDAPVIALHESLEALADAPPKRAAPSDDGPSRVEVLEAVRARGPHLGDDGRARLRAIEQATMPSRPPPREGPLSDPVVWSIEEQISCGGIDEAEQRIAELERKRGPVPSVVYLRSRAALLAGREAPQVVAQRISGLVAVQPFAELELLAAQAWAAAGNMGRAVPYARLLAMDPTADRVLRVQARGIVEAANRGEPSVPPSLPPPHYGLEGGHHGHGSGFPSEAPTPPVASGRSVLSEPPAPTSRRPTTRPAPARRSTWPRELMRGASAVPPSLAQGGQVLAEHLEDPAAHEVGRHAAERARFTEMVRRLAADYRAQRSVTLTFDAGGLELVQLGLRERHGAGVDGQEAAQDVRRHGAFLAELLARRARGQWIAVDDEELGYWRMDVAGVTVQPFGRVLRHLALGPRERDLVAFYLGLVVRAHDLDA